MQTQISRRRTATWSYAEQTQPLHFARGTAEMTARVTRLDVEDPDPDRLELCDDPTLTVQMRAVKSGRSMWLFAIAASTIALAAGIAFVL
jgi:hypothetical protein